MVNVESCFKLCCGARARPDVFVCVWTPELFGAGNTLRSECKAQRGYLFSETRGLGSSTVSCNGEMLCA